MKHSKKLSLSGANSQIFSSFVKVLTFFGVGKLVGALKELVLAWRFGVGPVMDSYVYAFSIALWLPTFWQGLTFIVGVPALKSVEKQDYVSNTFRNQFFGMAILFGSCASFLIAIIALFTIMVGLSGTMSVDANNGYMLLTLSPLVLFAVIAAYLSSLLISRGNHINSLIEGVPSLVIIVLLLLMFGSHARNTGIDSWLLALVTVIGFVVQTLCLYLIIKHLKLDLKPVIKLNSPVWTTFRQGISIMVVSQGLMSIIPLIDVFFALRLQEGMLSVYGYCQRLLLLATSLAGIAIARATLPVFSDKTLDVSIIFASAKKWSAIFFVVGVIGMFIASYFREFFVQLLFERGEFDHHDTAIVAKMLGYGLYQLPFFMAGIVCVQYLASQKRYSIILYSSIIALLIKLVAGFVLTNMYGLAGLFLSTMAVYAGTYLFFLYILMFRSHAAI